MSVKRYPGMSDLQSGIEPDKFVLASDHDAEVERLRGLLRVYGRHLDSCGDAGAYNHADVPSCGCGFDAALKENASE